MADLSICMFSRGIMPWAYGGVETTVWEVSRRLVRRGCHVSVICTLPCETCVIETEGISVSSVRNGAIPNVSYALAASHKAIELDTLLSFDIFHGHGFYGFGLSLLKALLKTHKPFVTTLYNVILRDTISTLDSTFFYRTRSLGKNLSTAVAILAYAIAEATIITRVADRVLAISEYTRADAVRTYRIPLEKIEVIPLGVDTERFRPNVDRTVARYTLRLDNESPLILCVGRLDQRKGVEYIVSALHTVLRSVKNTKLVILGDGPFKRHLYDLASRLRVEHAVIFHRPVPLDVLPYFYAACDLYVQPSRWEGFGLAILEAMASGKPVVATAVGSIPEIVTHGYDGLLVKPKDTLHLARAISTLLMNRDLREKMGRRARSKAESYSWDSTAQRILQAYQSLAVL